MSARRSFLAGLFGQGVGPSLTPELHEREAVRQGVRYVYKTVDLAEQQTTPERLRELLAAAVELGFDGLNVTHPVKQTMVPLVDRVSDGVEAIGALNTVLIGAGGTVGHNTDVTGFGRSFEDGLAGAPRDEVVLLGAGGAGTAVAHALLAHGVRRLRVADPDVTRAEDLSRSVPRLADAAEVVAVSPEDVADAIAAADGLVNATPIGMAAHPGTPVPTELLRPGLWVADIVYRPLHTPLLLAAAERGCRTLTGAGMAVHQAADAFELITGLPADRAAMFGDLEELVGAEVRRARLDPQVPDTPDERNP
ncbi:shikimate dehydrogenase [Nocardioides dongkuii]|uniref:shikimate dehydrogenase n=1 Tax=Nocardioides dongkuii TaxID=2760089 RepID=UPI0015F9BA98|nr:shikimate dehydrogenase [Nocardioides dongkuii]